MLNHQEIMREAFKASKKSHDPDTRVGCVIVDKAGNVVADGYNRLPGSTYRNQHRIKAPFKNYFMLHAEIAALLRARVDLSGFTLATTLYPCHACAAAIIQAGIKTVLYHEDRTNDASASMFFESSVAVIKVGNI